MFKKFFGKKNDGFYMQADESAPPKAAPAPEAKVDVAKEAVPQSENIQAAVAASPGGANVTTALTTTVAAAEQKTKSAKTSIKKDKKKDQKEEKAATVQPQVMAAAPVAPAFTNFATDYLVTAAVAGNRRRPGANMKDFMSMARDVKEMKKGSQANQQKAAKKAEKPAKTEV